MKDAGSPGLTLDIMLLILLLAIIGIQIFLVLKVVIRKKEDEYGLSQDVKTLKG